MILNLQGNEMTDGTKEGFKTAKQIVEELLAKYEALRDSDKKLYLGYLYHYTDFRRAINTAKDPYKAFVELWLDGKTLNYNTIRRIRADFQSKGKYRSSKQIEEERARRDEESTDYFRNS